MQWRLCQQQTNVNKCCVRQNLPGKAFEYIILAWSLHLKYKQDIILKSFPIGEHSASLEAFLYTPLKNRVAGANFFSAKIRGKGRFWAIFRRVFAIFPDFSDFRGIFENVRRTREIPPPQKIFRGQEWS